MIKRIQIKSLNSDGKRMFYNYVTFHKEKIFKQMTINCELGSLIITESELLEYLKKRNEQEKKDMP